MGCRPQGSREGSVLTINRHNVLAAGARGFGRSRILSWTHGLAGCAAPLARARVAAEQEASGEGECVGQQGRRLRRGRG
jgi:hypothetical protein